MVTEPFTEADVGLNAIKYLDVHTESRNLGKQVAGYYRGTAVDICSGKEKFFTDCERIIREYNTGGNGV